MCIEVLDKSPPVIDSHPGGRLNDSGEVNTFITRPGIHPCLRLCAGYLLAVSPLSSDFLVDSFCSSELVASRAHVLLPLFLGILGVSYGIARARQGNVWIGMGQIAVTLAAIIGAYVVAGFAMAVSHGHGI